MTRNVLADYLTEIARIHGTGAGTGEISYYGALAGALNAVGAGLKPRVFCVPNLRNRGGVGFPDMGLFAGGDPGRADAWPQGRPPDRGVVEVDDIPAALEVKLRSAQVARYLAQYHLVLVTNFRAFVLLGQDSDGQREVREQFDFGCADGEAFFTLARATTRPKAMAARFAEFLQRVLLHQAPLARPEDVAFFLASYARDALARVEERADLPAFAALRGALQETLGLQFEDTRGEHLFRSTLVQTLFYGLFSAWVEVARAGGRFDWHAAGWNLHVPFIAELFQRIATPQQLRPLGLEEPLAWAAAALERVARAAFFARFDDAEAVRYFYEPFLAAFDPELRKALGVWYTPREIVRYMVERVDHVLRSELLLTDGLADPSVWVLDPCCGTGAYLVAVLERIEKTLREKGEGALAAEDLKHAAMTRVAGFEIMPAPYVVAHWQIGHTLRAAGIDLAEGERAAIYLTNALTGWAAPNDASTAEVAQLGLRYSYPPLAEERDAATRVKRERPILVVLGNPPYNAFAGTSPSEESGLVEPYKVGLHGHWKIKKFNLDDLYVRFFRVAERRIAEGTGRGVVCFISNHSWLWFPSFVVMRERLLREFNRLWLDNLNGSKFETGKLAPDGSPDPSVFSTDANREGIQVGTAISVLVRTSGSTESVPLYRDLWGRGKRDELLASLDAADFDAQYVPTTPTDNNRFVLRPSAVGADYESWPSLADIANIQPTPGLLEMRREALVGRDREDLARRMKRYFDPHETLDILREANAGPVWDMARFDAAKARESVLRVEAFKDSGIRRFRQRPFDEAWCYYTPTRPIWNEPRPNLAAVGASKPALISRPYRERPAEGPHMLISNTLPDYHLLRPNCSAFAFFQDDGRANLSSVVRTWLASLCLPDPDTARDIAALPWQHAVAIGYAPAWLSENGDGIRQDWPRVPLPNNAALLRASATLGARVAALLEPETVVPGVTAGMLDPAIAAIAVPARVGGGAITEADRAVTAGWGHAGKGEAVMPGRGKLTARAYADQESAAAEHAALLGAATCDVFLNEVAYWRNIPESVWNFSIGGYQVLKKYLSYRERPLLGRALTPAEVRYVRDVARRLAALRLMGPALDANYRACAAAHRPLGAN